MITKRLRQNTITKIVGSMEIDSQESLARELRNRGVQVSQSTLSRDIAELGLAKAGNVYITGIPEVPRTSDHTLRLVLREFVAAIDSVEYFLILKTATGSASSVAEALDERGWGEIAGTIAGDNTIFVLCRSVRAVNRVQARIQEFLQ
jgi:transcriptional regulator of arginine metabolism